MKKKAMVALLVAIVSIFGLVGCSQQQTGSATPPVTPKKLRLVIGGSSPGGTSYILMGGLASIINKYVDGVSATVETTTGSQENARLVATGGVDISTSFYQTAELVKKGEKPYDKSMDTLRIAMTSSNPPVAQFVVRADSDIKSIADLKGRKISVGPPGSSMATILVPEVLKSYGLSMDDVKAKYLGANETANALINRDIDCGGILAAPPASGVNQIAASVDIKLIPFSKEDMDKIVKAHPYFMSYTIKGGTYSGINEDTVTVAMPDGLIVNKDLPEEVVYNIVKAVHEHQAEWINVHPAAAGWLPEVLAERSEAIKDFLPLHPGAEKYLKEKGLLK